MKHLSLTTLCRLCERLRLTMGKTPVHSEDCGTINAATNEPIKVECARAKSSCFLECLHYLFTWKDATQLQKSLREQQRKQQSRSQSFYYPPFDPSLSLMDRGGLESDLHILAELLGVHFYECREKKESPDGITLRGTNAAGMARRQSICTTASKRRDLNKGRDVRALITGMHPRAT